MDNVFKIRELAENRASMPDHKTAFTFFEIEAGEELSNARLPVNYIFFVLSGEVTLCCNGFINHSFRKNEMVFLQKSSAVKVTVPKNTKLCVFCFDMFVSPSDQYFFSAFLPDAEKTAYQFRPIAIPPLIRSFLYQLRLQQAEKIDCKSMNTLKHCEFFVLLRYLCPREDLVELMHRLICKSLDFRNKVIDKYMKMEGNRVTELAKLVNMGRKNFDKRFRAEFGTSPAKWMQQEMAKRLHLFLQTPGITISDAMYKFHFNSPSHFNRFCHHFLEASPGTIIKEAKTWNQRTPARTDL